MEEEIIIVIRPKRAANAQSLGGTPEQPIPAAYEFKTYESAVKFLAAHIKD